MNDSPHLPASQPTRRLRPGLGAELQAARQARGVDLAAAAAHLLLSPRQVANLESDDASAFHNDGFRLRAAEAYARWLGVPDPIQSVAEDDRPVSEVSPTPPARRPFILWGAAGGLAVLGLAAALVWPTADGALPVAAPLPARDVPQTVTAGGPGPAVAAAAEAPGERSPVGEPLLLLETDEPAWLFVRYADGSTVERGLEAGAPFDLGSDPVYLVVGGERAVLRRGVKVRRLDPWSNGTEIRLNRANLLEVLAELRPQAVPPALP